MTSIEYLIEQLEAPCRGIPIHIVEKAKEMHKQEIEDAHGIKTISINQYMSKLITGEQYYNETFKKD